MKPGLNKKRLIRQLSGLRGSKTLIITIGNTLKADDGAGPYLYKKLCGQNITAQIIDAGTVPENYVHYLVEQKPENILIIDALDFGASAGEIRIFEPGQLVSSAAVGTHALSPQLFAEIISSQIETRMIFLVVQPKNIRMGDKMSAPVVAAVEMIAEILKEIFSSP